MKVITGRYNPDGVQDVHCPYCGAKAKKLLSGHYHCEECNAWFVDGSRPFVVLVTEGVYSDYHIVGAFSSRHLARKFLRMYRSKPWHDLVRVEEFELDVCLEKIKTTVYMDQDGNVPKVEYEFDVESGFKGFQSGLLVWTVDTTDVVRAIKVVNEKRTLILVHDVWDNEEAVRQLFGGDVDGS
ncbi:MAG: hypothetical protein DRJ38_00340 [Thermoprotei archaeon]|nr:MAG: hypothetical protein DRJ38_00340 [Thermoprotei archaeon]